MIQAETQSDVKLTDISQSYLVVQYLARSARKIIVKWPWSGFNSLLNSVQLNREVFQKINFDTQKINKKSHRSTITSCDSEVREKETKEFPERKGN